MKRRAEYAMGCDAPCKRYTRSCDKIDTPLPVMDIACAVTYTSPLQTLPGKHRKRALEEPGLQETPPADEKSPVVKCTLDNGPLRRSGRFEKKSGPEPAPAPAATSKRRREVEEVPPKMSKSDEGILAEDDLSAFNSFQFWRVPLLSLDMSVLESDNIDATRSLSSEAVDMET